MHNEYTTWQPGDICIELQYYASNTSLRYYIVYCIKYQIIAVRNFIYSE